MLDGNNFDQKLLQTIKENKIEPTPKWQFVAKDYAVWVAGLGLFIIGAMAVSIVIYVVSFDDWASYQKTGAGFLDFILIAIPFFWLAFLVISIAAVYLDFKKTKKGYRYSTWLVFAVVITASVLLGLVLYLTGVGEVLDDAIGQRAPFYDQVINPHIHFWANPENGRLSGVIVSQSGKDEFILTDGMKVEWKIDTTGMDPIFIGLIQIGKPVNIIGENTFDHEFKAKEILPLKSGKGFYNRPKSKSEKIHDNLESFLIPSINFQKI